MRVRLHSDHQSDLMGARNHTRLRILLGIGRVEARPPCGRRIESLLMSAALEMRFLLLRWSLREDVSLASLRHNGPIIIAAESLASCLVRTTHRPGGLVCDGEELRLGWARRAR